jgi:outer membrane lipoprotein-sorting protein
MRRFVCLATALVVVAAGAARADEKADSKAVIEKAIKAVGGEEKLAKFNSATFKMKGKWYGMGEGIDYTGEVAVQVPDKTRIKIDTGAGDMKFTFIRVVNGDKVWSKLNNDTTEVDDKDQVKEAKEELYADRVKSLLPLVKEKGFTLEALGEVKVDDKPAVGVRVTHKGHRDINLFFNKESGLLVKSEQTVKDFMAGGNEQMQETLYSEYKKFGGTSHATKMVINREGKKYIDAEISDLEAKDKIDGKEFDKP